MPIWIPSHVEYTVTLWSEIDSAINLRECRVYSYISDLSEDPLSRGQM